MLDDLHIPSYCIAYFYIKFPFTALDVEGIFRRSTSASLLNETVAKYNLGTV